MQYKKHVHTLTLDCIEPDKLAVVNISETNPVGTGLIVQRLLLSEWLNLS